jgi:hypothetical protein
MRQNIFIFFCCISILFISSCKEDNLAPIENDEVTPGTISNVTVENLAGAAQITYTLPSDPDLLYIAAEYVAKNGKKRQFKSSYYTNTIKIEGFGDTDDYNVELYAVDRSENRSTPVNVTVKPLTPPVLQTYNSLKIVADFGGVTISFKNPVEADLAIGVCTTDSLGDLITAETYYTSRDSADFSVRGYKSEPRLFGIFIRDRWDNNTDTLFQELTPIYEVKLNKTKFKEVILPGDSPVTSWGGAMTYIWDGLVLPDFAEGAGNAHTGNLATGVPMYFTFDLGVVSQLSRFSLNTVPDDKHFFNDVSPRKYEIWGCQNFNPDGSFDSWTKLITIENVKPSGLPAGLLTEDDRIAGLKGDEANFPLEIPKVRYIRIRCLNNWSGNTNMVISEVTFWGDDK